MTAPFTTQELTYLATGARVLARQARSDADRQDNPGIRASFEQSETIYLALVAKCERLAQEPARVPLEVPVIRMA
jgi:hypothetical protein